MLTKDLLIDKYAKQNEKKYACWNDIITAYEMDKNSFLKQRQMPKFCDKHIYIQDIPKMKVKYATQVISHTVANFMDIILTLNLGNIYSLTNITMHHLLWKDNIYFKFLFFLSFSLFLFLTLLLYLITGTLNTKKGEMCFSQNAATTCQTILFFDDLFDSFNTTKKQELASIISKTSKHLS